MARNIYEDTSATILGKSFTTIFCLFVAFFFVQSNMIGGGILQSYTSILVEMDPASAAPAYANSPTILGGPVQTIFQVFILAFQFLIFGLRRSKSQLEEQ